LTSDNARLDDRVEALEPPYRSRGEAQVGRLLDRYGIPFFHEYPLLVLDRGRYRTWHPDFYLPAHGGLIVEYAGMPNVPDYMAGIRHKEEVFRENRVPALFLYPWHLRRDDWGEYVTARIDYVHENRPTVLLPRPEPRH
jgi:hypothetical protein